MQSYRRPKFDLPAKNVVMQLTNTEKARKYFRINRYPVQLLEFNFSKENAQSSWHTDSTVA